MNTTFREVVLPLAQNNDNQPLSVETFYVYHDTVDDLPSNDTILKAAAEFNTLVMESVEPNMQFNATDNIILNGSPSERLLLALEHDARHNPRAKILSLLAQTGIRSVVVEPPAESKLWTLRRKRLLQTEAATNQVIASGISKKTVDAYTKARRLYIKDAMAPRDDVATEGILNLLDQSERVLSFWGSAHMSIALALDREGISQRVEVPLYQVLDIEPSAQIVDEFRNGGDVQPERLIPWLVVELAACALQRGVGVHSNSSGRVTELNGMVIDRTVSMPFEQVDTYLNSAGESLKKGSTLIIP